MKTIDPTIIEKGAVLLDKATWAEFLVFAKEVMKASSPGPSAAREKLFASLEKCLREDNRGRAIALWRAAALEWTDVPAGAMRERASEMLRTAGVLSLTSRQLQVASGVYGSLVSGVIAADEVLDAEGLLLFFALSATMAVKFEHAASVLGVRLP